MELVYDYVSEERKEEVKKMGDIDSIWRVI